MPTRIAKVETLARHIVQALALVSAGRPQVWRSVDELTDTIAGAEAAVQLAAEKGWVLIEGGHSVCLTEEGRRLAKS
jgi:hypothetical protein